MLRVVLAMCSVACCCLEARGQSLDKAAALLDESASYQAEVLVSGLDNPTGICLRPDQSKSGPFELYVAESGAGRVARLSTRDPKQVDEVIVDFPTASMGQEGEYRVGPLGLSFLTRTNLAVTTASSADGRGQIACYSVRPSTAAITADQPTHVVEPVADSGESSAGEPVLGSLAMAGKSCFVASAGQGHGGSIFKCDIEANRFGSVQELITFEATQEFHSPGGIAVIPPPRPPFLVAGLMGTTDTPGDSRLLFFVPATGDVALNLPTGLDDIVGLAYSPSGQLYAADFSWRDEQAGGVYRLDDVRVEGRQSCRPVKIASLARPFGMAFAPDGSLFVTAFGSGENAKQGTLIRITGKL